jgi:hypothetical protein
VQQITKTSRSGEAGGIKVCLSINKNTMRYSIYLVGGIPNPLKNMSLSVGMSIPNIWKNKKCSKPPTSYS